MTLNAYLASELKRIEPILTRDFQAAARQAGWPASVYRQLSVTVNGTKIELYIPSSLGSTVEDLEYGLPGTPPRPVMRKFIDSNNQTLADTIAEGTFNYLFDSGALP